MNKKGQIDLDSLFEDVPLPAIVILNVVGFFMLRWIFKAWIGKGMQISIITQILTHLIMIPISIGIGYIIANKE